MPRHAFSQAGNTSKTKESNFGQPSDSDRSPGGVPDQITSDDKPVGQTPLFSFGVIGDIQYADVDNGWDFHKTNQRYFRNTLNVLSSAMVSWNSEDLAFCAQMGDIIDGKCNGCTLGVTNKIPDIGTGGNPETRLGDVLEVFGKLKCPRVDVLGNHEFYNFKRDQLPSVLNVAGKHSDGVERTYYSFRPHPGWRVIVLNSFDIATIGYPKDHPNYKAARAILEENNPNDTLGTGNWTKGLSAEAKRFVPLNGAIGKQQLEWLRSELQSTAADRDQAIILMHVPLYCKGYTNRMWNYNEVLEVIHEVDCVRACIYGHKHLGDYLCDQKGIHNFTMKSPLVVPPKNDCHATVDVYPSRIVMRGSGHCESHDASWKAQ